MNRHRAKWKPILNTQSYAAYTLNSPAITSDSMLVQSLGLGKKRPILKPDAVPTLFTKPVSLKRKSEMDHPSSTCKKRRFEFEKRER